jgi:hypothetical protein
MKISVPISVGELLDKISILEVKRERIQDKKKRANIVAQLKELRSVAATLPKQRSLHSVEKKLYVVNRAQWDWEDAARIEIRLKNPQKVALLVHKIHMSNDRRALLKRQIDVLFDSDIVEEKSYAK